MPQLSKLSGRALAWGAIVACSLGGGLTLLTFSASANETSTEASSCRNACYAAYGACSKAAGDNMDKQSQCKADASNCVTKCPAEVGSTAPTTTPKPPEVSSCRNTCYSAYSACSKAAGDSMDKQAQCKADASNCVNKCPGEEHAMANEQPKSPKPPEASSCRTACYKAFGDCNKAAGDNVDKQTQCKTAGNACLAPCGDEKPATMRNSDKSYEEAVAAARQHFLDGQKRLLEEYQAALEKAWAARLKASTSTK